MQLCERFGRLGPYVCTLPKEHNGDCRLELDDAGERSRREQFREDMDHILHKAYDCTLNHKQSRSGQYFCDNCIDDLWSSIEIRRHVYPGFRLEENEMRGLLRQLHRQHITHEGSSGPVVHALMARIKAHLPKEKYEEFLKGA